MSGPQLLGGRHPEWLKGIMPKPADLVQPYKTCPFGTSGQTMTSPMTDAMGKMMGLQQQLVTSPVPCHQLCRLFLLDPGCDPEQEAPRGVCKVEVMADALLAIQRKLTGPEQSFPDMGAGLEAVKDLEKTMPGGEDNVSHTQAEEATA